MFIAQTQAAFGALNYTTLAVYLAGTFAIGIFFSSRNKTTEDYFKASHSIPWWAAGMSIFATMLSSITYMSIPAKAFADNWLILLVNLPILLLAPAIIYLFLPHYRRIASASAYEYLETRFGLPARLYGGSAFVLFQTARMALVMYLPALALSTVTDINIFVCIILMGILSAIYSAAGGIQAVIWTDVVQTIVLLGAALLSFFLILWRLEGGFSELVQVAAADNKLQMVKWSGDYTTNVLWVVLIGSMFTQLVPYVSDQSIIQRYMTTKDKQACARAVWVNAIMAMPATMLFLGLGTAIYVYYKANEGKLEELPRPDAILPYFIARELPAGVAGVVVAGIFAAAQSTVSTSLNSISTVLVTDFLKRLGGAHKDEHWLAIAKWLTGAFGLLATILACLLAVVKIDSAFDAFQRILGLTGSGLGGLFLLGMFTKRTNLTGAMTGAIVSAIVLYFLQGHSRVHFYLYAMIGILVCFGVGYAVSLIFPTPRRTINDISKPL